MLTILTITLAFISTNIDDFLLLIILFSQVGTKIKRKDIFVGQYIGSAFLVLISAIASIGLSFLSSQKVGWLGFIPIILGVKTFMNYQKEKKQIKRVGYREVQLIGEADKEKEHGSINQILVVAILTISNGADNIAVYITLFNRYNLTEWLLIVVIFSVMIVLWCYLGFKLVAIPFIKDKLNRMGYIIVPIVFIALGCFILKKNGLLF